MKNLLLFSTLLITTTAAFAQLTVKPNGATDSYVYVSDQILYVDNYVNLTKNPSSDKEASIYLRNDGQMIQGGSVSTNTGNGFLSAQQNSDPTNAWAYYYWCSPVGTPSAGPATGNTKFGVHSIYQPTGLTDAYMSQTTTGYNGSISPLTISTRWLYTFTSPGTEAEGDYTRMNAGSNAPAGFGFTMKGVGPIGNGNQVYDFRGRPNSGDFPIPIENNLMTLAGNPYPSALDLNKLFYDTGNEKLKQFWYYDEDRTVASHNYATKPYGYGVYVPGPQDSDSDPDNGPAPGMYAAAPFYYYNASGTHGGQIGTSSNNDQNKRFAPIGQGIMFVGDGNGDITIRNSQRVFKREGAAEHSVFQRPEGDNNLAGADDHTNSGDPSTSIAPHQIDYRAPQMRLWVVFDEAVTRDLVIAFYDQATDSYDRGLDGGSPMDLKTDAYFPVATHTDYNFEPYVIDAVKYDYGKQIPITFKLNKQTTFSVGVVEEVKKPYENAYLYDNVEHTYKRINNGGTITGARGATYTLPAGTYDDRFFIVFRAPQGKGDGPDPLTKKKNDVLANVTFFQNNPQRQLEVTNPEGYDIKSASMYDMNGKMVISESNLGDSKKLSFYTGNLSNGVYLVKLTTQDDITIDYKAIVYNK